MYVPEASKNYYLFISFVCTMTSFIQFHDNYDTVKDPVTWRLKGKNKGILYKLKLCKDDKNLVNDGKYSYVGERASV